MRKGIFLLVGILMMQMAVFATKLTDPTGTILGGEEIFVGSNIIVIENGGTLYVYFTDNNGTPSSANTFIGADANAIHFGIDYDQDGKKDMIVLTNSGAKVYETEDRGGAGLSEKATILSAEDLRHIDYSPSNNVMLITSPFDANGEAKHVFVGQTTAHREVALDESTAGVGKNGLEIANFKGTEDVVVIIGGDSTINIRVDEANFPDTSSASGNGAIVISNGDQYAIRSMDFADVIKDAGNKEDILITHNTTATGYEGVFIIAGNANLGTSLTPTVNAAHRDVWISNDIDSAIPYASYATVGSNLLLVISWVDGMDSKIEFIDVTDGIVPGDYTRSAFSANVFSIHFGIFNDLHFQEFFYDGTDEIKIILQEDISDMVFPFPMGKGVAITASTLAIEPGDNVQFSLSTEAGHDTGFYVSDNLVSSNTTLLDYTFTSEGNYQVYAKARHYLSTNTSNELTISVAYPELALVDSSAKTYTQNIRGAQNYSFYVSDNISTIERGSGLDDVSFTHSDNLVSFTANSISPYVSTGVISITSVYGKQLDVTIQVTYENATPSISGLTGSVNIKLDETAAITFDITDTDGAVDIGGYSITSTLFNDTLTSSSSSGNTGSIGVTLTPTAVGSEVITVEAFDIHGERISQSIAAIVNYPDLTQSGLDLMYSYVSGNNVSGSFSTSYNVASVSANVNLASLSFSGNTISFTHTEAAEGTYGITFSVNSTVGTSLDVSTTVQVTNEAGPQITNLTPSIVLSQDEQSGTQQLQFVITDTDDNIDFSTATLNNVATSFAAADNVYSLSIDTSNLTLGDHIFVVQVADTAGYIGQAISSISIQATTSANVALEYDTPAYTGQNSWEMVGFPGNMTIAQFEVILESEYGTIGTTENTDVDVRVFNSSDESYTAINNMDEDAKASTSILGLGFMMATKENVKKSLNFVSAGTQELVVSLRQGWNLLSVPYDISLSVSDIKISGNAVKDDSNTLSGHHFFNYSKDIDEYLSLSGEVPSGIGFFLYSNADQELTFGPYDPNVSAKPRAKSQRGKPGIQGTPISQIDLSDEPAPPVSLAKASATSAASGGGGGGCLLK